MRTTIGSRRETTMLCQFESCELSKYHHVHFPISSNKTNVHFSIVHSDIWGLSKTVTLTGHNGLSTLLIIFLALFGFIYLKRKGRCATCFRFFIKQFVLNLVLKLKFFSLIMGRNVITPVLILILPLMALFTKPLALILPNKMEWLTQESSFA